MKEIIKIQMDFMSGWGYEGRKITWIKWKRKCKTIDDGGLGVKEMRCFNMTLLDKWRWRLEKKKEVWGEIF